MSNPIDRILDSGARRLQERNQPQAQPANPAGPEPETGVRSSALLDLTGRAKELKALEKELASSPEFDSNRVNALRQSLSDGSYQVDAKRIADKLLSIESQLL